MLPALAVRWTPILLVSIVQHAGAVAPDAQPCNSRRLPSAEIVRKIPDFERTCFHHAVSLIRESTGHDFRLGEAEGILDTLLQLSPETPYAWAGYAELKMRKLELGYPSELPGQIREFAERAVRMRPVLPEALVTLGKIHLLLRCLPCAKSASVRAAALRQESTDLQLLEAAIAEQLNDVARATRLLHDALAYARSAADRSRVQIALGKLYASTGALEEAERTYQEAIKQNPRSPLPRIEYASYLLYHRGDAERAHTSAQDSLGAGPTREARIIASMALYLSWSQEYLKTKTPSPDIKQLIQTSFVGPDEALVLAARHRPLSPIIGAFLASGTVRDRQARDGDGNSALIAAAMGNNPDVARTLLDRQADPNARNTRGERALGYFAMAGNLGVVTLLVERGAVVNYADKDGNSPLSLAVQRRHAGVTRHLLKHGARILRAGVWSAGELLNAAVINDDPELVAILLDHGVTVNDVDASGRPAIIAAIFFSSTNALKLLIERGVSSDTPFMGRTALDYARETGNIQIIRMLEDARKLRT